MRPSELTIEVCDRSLARVAQIKRQYWSDIKLMMRHRRVGSWSMSLPAELDACQALATPGYGLLVQGPTGVLFSGVTDAAKKKTTTSMDRTGTVTFTGYDHNVLLADALAFPSPTVAEPSAQTVAYDVRSGPGESVIRAYVNANIGPSAPAARRAALAQKLTLLPDLARGTTVRGEARFVILGELLETLGMLSGVGYRIVQNGAQLQLELWEPANRSATVRLDLENGRLTSTDYDVSAPTVTQAIVAGQGEGVDRTLLRRTSTDASAAESVWGRRIEVFRDQRQTDVTAELEQAGDELLVEGGRTLVQTRVTPTDDLTMRFQRDWNLGDIITTVVNDLEVQAVVSTVGIGITSEGVRIGAKVGD